MMESDGLETHEGSWEDRFSRLIPERQEQLQASWTRLQAYIERFEIICDPQVLARVENPHPTEAKQVTRSAREIRAFYGKIFGPEENMDLDSYKTAVGDKVFDTYLIRDEGGRIISALSSSHIKLAAAMPGRNEALLAPWWIATQRDYKGHPVTIELWVKALQDFLSRSKENLTEVAGIATETDHHELPRLEQLYNRMGLRRLFMADTQGLLQEVPYEAPPNEPDEKPIPGNLMFNTLNPGKNSISVVELQRLVDGLHREYDRPEYWGTEPGTEEDDEERGPYVKVVDALNAKFDKAVSGAREIRLMSRKDIENATEEEKVIEWKRK